MSDGWRHDDDSISGATPLLRRVPLDQNCFALDLVRSEPVLAPGALIFHDDGMSVYLEPIIEASGHVAADLRKSEEHFLARFPASAPRAGGGGVVQHDDVDDLVFGKAHGLVRASSPKPDRPTRTRIRARIAAAAEWVIPPPADVIEIAKRRKTAPPSR